MIKNISQIENLPENIKQEIINYADYLVYKYGIQEQDKPVKKWIDNIDRGNSSGEKASETVIKMRKESKW